MKSYSGAFGPLSWLLVALFALLGPLWAVPGYAQEAQTAAPAAIVTDWQDLGTLNPALQADVDEPGLDDPVVTNPVTDDPLTIDAQLAMWLIVLGFIASPLVAALNRYVTDGSMRAVVAFVACLALGFLDVLIRGTLNPANLTGTVLLVFTAAITFYNLYLKPAGLAAKIEHRV